MGAKRLVGPEAGVRKYDLLTALAVAGLSGGPQTTVSMMRLIALITARYNWRADEVSIGQADLARLWSVDLRTVKREMRRLKDLGLVVVKRPGVRGRVASYALDHARIDALTEGSWGQVGPDFQDRMAGQAAGQGAAQASGQAAGQATGQGAGQAAGLPAGNAGAPTVIPFPGAAEDRGSEWARAKVRLRDADPARHRAWFQPLVRQHRDGTCLILRAPSAFHAGYVQTHLLGEIVRAVAAADPEVRQVEIVA